MLQEGGVPERGSHHTPLRRLLRSGEHEYEVSVYEIMGMRYQVYEIMGMRYQVYEIMGMRYQVYEVSGV